MKKISTALLLFFIYVQFSFAQTSPVVQNILNQVNQDSVVHYVKELSGYIPTVINGSPYTILSRHKFQPGNDMATQYLKEKLESYGLTTTIQTFSSTGKNVYAVQPGYMYPNKKFIICAHMDDMPSGTIAPGADDNASGTAAVIEAARILRNYSFPYTIVYALWDEEEQGLIGSAYYATQAYNAGDSIMGVVNLDMIAFDSNNDMKCDVHARPTAGNSLALADKMLECNVNYGIGLTFVVRNPGSTYSDHASFWSKNYGAILLIENDNDFHTQYHTVRDTLGYFNIPYFLKMTKVSIATVASLALNLTLTMTHTPIASGEYSSSIQTTASIETGLKIGTGSAAPRLYYRLDQGSGYSSFNEVTGVPAGGTIYNFTIPQIAAGSSVQYYIAAQDSAGSLIVTLPAGGIGINPPGSTPPSTFYQFFNAPLIAAMYDSANNINNWTSENGWNTTVGKYVSPPSSFTESPSSLYSNNLTASLTYNNNIIIENALGAVLEFDTQWDIESNYDYGQVRISTNNGISWTPLRGQYMNLATGNFQPAGQYLYDGIQSSWVREKIDISGYIGQPIRIQFYFRSDGNITKDGWYIDNIAINAYSIVPVELAMFNAEAGTDGVHLKWITSAETNNSGFDIQRSGDGSNWNQVAFVGGKGTSTEVNYYSYTDKFYGSGLYYYRLLQKDYDGSITEYPAVEVDLTGAVSYVLEQNYPNPFNPVTTIKYSVPQSGRLKLAVFNMIGEEVAVLVDEMKEPGKYEIRFDASSLSSGIYIYRMESGSFRDVKKLILMK
jgi:hypothetical protein